MNIEEKTSLENKINNLLPGERTTYNLETEGNHLYDLCRMNETFTLTQKRLGASVFEGSIVYKYDYFINRISSYTAEKLRLLKRGKNLTDMRAGDWK